jgi:hypothetical protein
MAVFQAPKAVTVSSHLLGCQQHVELSLGDTSDNGGILDRTCAKASQCTQSSGRGIEGAVLQSHRYVGHVKLQAATCPFQKDWHRLLSDRKFVEGVFMSIGNQWDIS